MLSLFSSTTLSALLLAGAIISSTTAAPKPSKRIVNGNLTPDGYYHNRYHALLSMAVYSPDYNIQCPNETFTLATELKNFPNATRPPWTVVNTFGPTPHGCEGFTAIIPEMNKAVIIFKGNYQLEQQLPLDVVDWAAINMSHVCNNCTANAFAMQGYAECRNETNNWQAIKEAYYGQGLVFSITGHGLGGMHSLIASVDLNWQQIDYYSHNYGTPRTFNNLGANWYNQNFNGEAGERGIYGNDNYTEFIPAGPNYTHTGTPFYYSGFDGQTLGPNMLVCWDGNDPFGPIVDDPACAPAPQDYPYNTTALQDHYYYFTEVGTCGGAYHAENTTIIDDFLASPAANFTYTPPAPSPTSTTPGTAVPTSPSDANAPKSTTPSSASTTKYGLWLSALSFVAAIAFLA